MFVGPDFSGHHFIACDAHDTWEGKHVFIPNLTPYAATLQKFDFKAFKTPCKTEYGDLRRNDANLRPNLGVCFLAFVWQTSWTANNRFATAGSHRFGQTT